jgi:hypothetical protein
MLRRAVAFTELYKGRAMKFPDGTMEVDATKSVIKKTGSKKTNTHCGRFLVIYHRESGQYCLEPLEDKDVLKGAPPPPESYDETKAPLTKKITKGHVLTADSGKAFKKVWKTHLKQKGVPFATVVHKKKQFCKLVKFPMTSLSKRIRDRVAQLPTTTRSTYRLKAADNMAENTFLVVKRNLRRLNLGRSTKNASVNFLAASFLNKNIGLEAVAKGIAFYQQSVLDKITPTAAFKSLDWLTKHEPLPEH